MTIFLTLMRGAWGFLSSLSPWVYAVIALVGLHFWLVHEARVQERDACTIQKNEMQAKWATELETKLKAAEDKAKAKDEAHAKALVDLGARYEKEITNAKAQRDKDVAAAHAGALVLRFLPDRPSSGLIVPNGAAGAPGSDGPQTVELPRAVTADLYALADDADAVVSQLSACQAVVQSDRKETP